MGLMRGWRVILTRGNGWLLHHNYLWATVQSPYSGISSDITFHLSSQHFLVMMAFVGVANITVFRNPEFPNSDLDFDSYFRSFPTLNCFSYNCFALNTLCSRGYGRRNVEWKGRLFVGALPCYRNLKAMTQSRLVKVEIKCLMRLERSRIAARAWSWLSQTKNASEAPFSSSILMPDNLSSQECDGHVETGYLPGLNLRESGFMEDILGVDAGSFRSVRYFEMNQAQEVVNSSYLLHPTCPWLPFTPISYPFSNKLIPICLHANLTIIFISISHPPRISSPPYPFLVFHATHTHHSSFIPYITIHQICHPLTHQFISINTFAFMPIISIITPTFSLLFHTSHVYTVIYLS